MSQIDDAVARFAQGWSCCQAVVAAFGPEFGLDETLAVRVAGGFGGGIGRSGQICGALSGAVMVLGLKYAAASPDDKQAKEAAFEKVRELLAQFRRRRGAVACNDLLGCDIGTAEGRQQIAQQQLTKTLCPKLVRDAAEILDGLLSQ